MDLALQQGEFIFTYKYSILVSTLVFMDLALQLVPLISENRKDTKSFNPCFHGFSITTVRGHENKQVCSLVSTLVFMDLALQLKVQTIQITWIEWFQPLFSWI